MNIATHIRDFEIISFIVRKGIVYRMDRQTHNLSNVDNIPGIIARAASSQVAMGRHVLVLESGCIKLDYCRVHHNAFHALETISVENYRKLIRNVESLNAVTRDAFVQHAKRSFPGM